MKYLKIFKEKNYVKEHNQYSYNESYQEIVKELQEFTDINLAYLIDEGYEVKVIYMGSVTSIKISGNKWDDSFDWDDIKDYFIPFITLISEFYTLDTNPINIQYRTKFSIDELDNLKPIKSVELFVNIVVPPSFGVTEVLPY